MQVRKGISPVELSVSLAPLTQVIHYNDPRSIQRSDNGFHPFLAPAHTKTGCHSTNETTFSHWRLKRKEVGTHIPIVLFVQVLSVVQLRLQPALQLFHILR